MKLQLAVLICFILRLYWVFGEKYKDKKRQKEVDILLFSMTTIDGTIVYTPHREWDGLTRTLLGLIEEPRGTVAPRTLTMIRTRLAIVTRKLGSTLTNDWISVAVPLGRTASTYTSTGLISTLTVATGPQKVAVIVECERGKDGKWHAARSSADSTLLYQLPAIPIQRLHKYDIYNPTEAEWKKYIVKNGARCFPLTAKSIS
ncbi:uncharacterized protein BDR25DRAFT_320041 [Lindgomyces ingoldianus]|uniref:Uncharacterized protein n=1 Tax=Lindgomyces ingoldianus TaxID=673940 RepID=A0ACB6QAE1_9PLEO|nr:uncharacterized protein BDR25DRAFT_320041 [Lindgomyces ingoldianus]KAF2463347.1 hypothetical protein BDR25DRAFT_320041 [Lindgomyces ingoldianus]